MTAHALTVEVPASQIITSNNERGHWAKRSDVKALLRHKAELLARAARLPKGLQRVHIVVHIDYPDRRKRDAHNLMPTIKPIIDGLVDAGVLVDDSDTHLIGPDLRPTGNVVKSKYVFQLDIKEVKR